MSLDRKKKEAIREMRSQLAKHAFGKDGSKLGALRGSSEGELGGQRVESLKRSHFASGMFRDQRVTTKRTPYAGVVVSTGEDENLDVIVGQFEAAWEHLKTIKDPGVEYAIEVQIALSEIKRNRVLSVSLFSPQVSTPDMKVHTVSRHLENMLERRQRDKSVLLKEWMFFFEEKDSRFDNVRIGKDKKGHRITVSGLVRLLREICESPPVTGDPFIRVGLWSSCGIVLRGSSLKNPSTRTLLKEWLYDIVEFTDSEERLRMWDPYAQEFVRRAPKSTEVGMTQGVVRMLVGKSR